MATVSHTDREETTLLIPVRSDDATSSAQEWSPAVVEDLLDAVRSAPDDVLLVCDAPAARRVANAVRALSGTPVAVLLLERPVTRWSLHVTALAGLAAHDLAFAPAVVRAVDEVVRTRVVLSGVGALADPSPGIGLHLLSWWPSTRFLVDLDRAEVLRTSQMPAVEAARVVVAHSDKEVLLGADRALPSRRTEVAGGAWRARRWLEVSEGPDDLATLAGSVVTGARTRPCVVCARPVVDDACPFCGVLHADPWALDRPLPTPHPEGVRL